MSNEEQETEQQDTEQQGDEQGGTNKDDAAQKAQESQERDEKAQETMEEIEKNPPEKLEDWPSDEAKYKTFGGGESDYDEKHEEALGEHSVRHHDDGKVEVKGEEADNPDDYKGEPIPGGPTDPDAPAQPGEEDKSDDSSDSDDKSDSDSDDESDSEN
jgi:hypothetical protein